MGYPFVVLLVILFQPMCTASSQQPPAAAHCSPAQEGSRHTLSKVFTLAVDDQVALATIVRSPNARAHLELAECTISFCQSRLAAYRASIRPHDVPGQYEVVLTIVSVNRKDGRPYLWYVNGEVEEECVLDVFDFSSDVICTPPRLLTRGQKEFYISVSCHIDMVYPKPECTISQAKDGKIIPKNYISSQTLNTDHYNHTCTMTMLATPDRLQEYQVAMFPEKLPVIKTGTRFARFNLSLPAVTLKDCPQNWTRERWRDYYDGGEGYCNLWRPESSSGDKGDDQLCGGGYVQGGFSNVFQRFVYPSKTQSCPTGFDPVGIYFDVKVEYPDSLSQVDITGFGIDSLHVGERRLLKLRHYYRIYTAFQPVPGQSVAFRLHMRSPFGFRKFVECYIPFYEHCPTLVSPTTTPKTDISTTTKRTTTTQRPTTTTPPPTPSTTTTTTTTTTSTTTTTTTSTTTPTTTRTTSNVPTTTTKANDGSSIRTETTTDSIMWPHVTRTWIDVVKGSENTTPSLKGQSVSSDAVTVDQSASSSTLLIVGIAVAVGGVFCVVVAVVCITIIRRRKRSKIYERPERSCGVNGRPGVFENALYESSVVPCDMSVDPSVHNGCEAEYAEVGDVHCGKEGLAVALPGRAEENPYETMSCRP